MNARWLRDNLSVLLFSVAFVCILGAVIWFLRAAGTEQATVVQELDIKKGELQRLQSNKIYPSVENIEVLKRDQEQLRRLYGLLQNAALREAIHPPDLEREIDFAQLMRATVARLSDSAKKNDVKVEESFTWGFSRYVTTIPCKNPAVKGDDCKRLLRALAKQLLIVEKLSGILIDSKVSAITAIRRSEIESGTSADSLAAPLTDDAKSLYRTYPFEVQFSADTDALRRFLNTLAQANHLYIVRSIQIGAVVQQIQLPAAPRPTSDLTEFEVKEPETPKTIETRRLNVTVRLDAVEFRPVEPKAGKR
ncbi:MAG: hypothetical protein PCFJNLEI_01569 [Verrucomicrobiae bacterium]|nr:hypothetical protein [Verrucomicrobiae bacterium]